MLAVEQHQYRTCDDVWNKLHSKLVLYVESLEITDQTILGKPGKEDPLVYIRVNVSAKHKAKTSLVKSSVGTVGEFLLFDLADPSIASSPIRIELKSNNNKSDVLSEASLAFVEQLAKETVVVNDSLPLLRVLKKAKEGETSAKTAFVKLRYYYSPFHAVLPKNSLKFLYSYEPHRKSLKTGDLILFNERGLSSAVVGLLSKSEFSRAGMVLRLPNRYTGKQRWYIVEYTRNVTSQFVDAFKETAVTYGISLFRLWERIHGHNEGNIWWAPLKQPLEDAPKANMVDWWMQMHAGKLKLDETIFVPPPPAVVRFLGGPNGLAFPKVANNPEFWEISSSHLMISALRMGGRRLPTEAAQFVTPSELVADFDCFEPPVQFKQAIPVHE